MSVLEQRLTEALNGDRPTLVMFYDLTDPRCVDEIPVALKAADKMAGQAHFFDIDVREYPDLKDKYHVHAYPTFILFVDGQQAWRADGRIPEAELEDMTHRFTLTDV